MPSSVLLVLIKNEVLIMAVTKKYDEDGKYPKGDINKVARMLNMSDEGIRIYQKKGLVFPAIKAFLQ